KVAEGQVMVRTRRRRTELRAEFDGCSNPNLHATQERERSASGVGVEVDDRPAGPVAPRAGEAGDVVGAEPGVAQHFAEERCGARAEAIFAGRIPQPDGEGADGCRSAEAVFG